MYLGLHLKSLQKRSLSRITLTVKSLFRILEQIQPLTTSRSSRESASDCRRRKIRPDGNAVVVYLVLNFDPRRQHPLESRRWQLSEHPKGEDPWWKRCLSNQTPCLSTAFPLLCGDPFIDLQPSTVSSPDPCDQVHIQVVGWEILSVPLLNRLFNEHQGHY